jgi:hypothetical protein
MIVVIRDDLHNERAGFYRAFTTDSLEDRYCCPCIGYCSSGGTHRTMAACVRELQRLGICRGMEVYSENSGRKLGTI